MFIVRYRQEYGQKEHKTKRQKNKTKTECKYNNPYNLMHLLRFGNPHCNRIIPKHHTNT